ncbi:TadE family protein [Georgenia subflava]
MELVILLPILFALMFLGMQGALIYHARSVALAAASEGAQTAAVEHGQASDGIAAASAFLADAGGDRVLDDASVTGALSATQATITVTGASLSVVPGWTPQVEQSASVTRELLSEEP